MELAAEDGGTARAGTVGAIVHAYLREQRDALHEGESALRNGEPAVHRTRVAVRRFRSTLRTFRALFADDLTVPIDGELRWYAQLLGHVRDREVQRERLAAAVAELAPEEIRGRVAVDIEEQLRAEQMQYETELTRELDGPRFQALMAELDEWMQNPPTTDRADRPARTMRKYVVRAEAVTMTKVAAALVTGDDAALHAARKAGKRARYAAEVAQELTGRKGRHQHKRLTAMQAELGEFQDSVVASEFLLRLGSVAEMTSGRDGFTYGLLYAREKQRADRARRTVAHLMADLFDGRSSRSPRRSGRARSGPPGSG